MKLHENFHVLRTKSHRQLLGLSLQGFGKLSQKVVNENCSIWSMRKVCKMVLPGPTCLFYWGQSACVPAVRMLLSAHSSLLLSDITSQLLSQSLPSHILCSCLETFRPTNTLCKIWQSNFQMSVPKCFAARTTYLLKNVMQFCQYLAKVNRISFQTFDQYPHKMEPLLVLKQALGNVFFVKTEYWKHF